MKKLFVKNWYNLVGSPNDFSLENRIFNAVGILCVLFLIILFPINIYIGQQHLSILLGIFVIIQVIVLYLVRIKRYFNAGVIIYGFGSYTILIINFFSNNGIDGPTFLAFLFTFHLLLAISPENLKKWWLFLHLCTIISLLVCEHLHFPFIIESYQNELYRKIDIFSTLTATILFTYAITNFIRGSYHKEKTLAEKRAQILEKQQQELSILNIQKDRIFSIIGTDMQQPLNLIKGYMALLTTPQNGFNEQQNKHLQNQLNITIDSTTIMLENLLYWSKVNLKEQTTELEAVDLMFCFSEALQSVQKMIAQKNLHVHLKTVHSCQIVSEKNSLVIVLKNILHNAIKYSYKGGNIYIDLYFKTNKACIDIKDEGIGMNTEALNHLFDIKASVVPGTQNEKGTGLGMVLCKQLLDQQMATVNVISTPNEGSCFSLSFVLAS